MSRKIGAFYDCETCKHSAMEWREIPFPAVEDCPKCGAHAYSRPSLRKTPDAGYWVPIQQYSIAMNSDAEIQAFRDKAPDVYVSSDPNDEMYGVPIARNYHQKKQSLRAAGFKDLRGYG
jgi:hypothetical protein